MGVRQLPAWYTARDMPERTESVHLEAFGIAVKRGRAGAITVQKRALLVAGTISDDGAGRTSPGRDGPQLAGRSALCREEFSLAESGTLGTVLASCLARR